MARRDASSLDDAAISRLRLVVMRLARHLRRHGPADITPAQLSTLSLLSGLGPLPVQVLADHEGVRQPTMSRVVRQLEAGGWVERVADPTDGRVVVVTATDTAEAAMHQLRAERDAMLITRLDSLDDADRARILAALPALERLLRAIEEP